MIANLEFYENNTNSEHNNIEQHSLELYPNQSNLIASPQFQDKSSDTENPNSAFDRKDTKIEIVFKDSFSFSSFNLFTAGRVITQVHIH